MKLNQSKKSESALQVECFTWFHNTYPNLRGLLFSVPNGGLRSKCEAARLKLEGLTPGVPDLLFFYQKNLYPFELKTASGTLSQEQIAIHNLWGAHGIEVTIIRDTDTFKQQIQRIIRQ